VKEELMNNGIAWNLQPRRMKSLLRKRKVSVRGSQMWEKDEDHLEKLFQHRDIVRT
jgi:hypothetical protein